MEGQLIKEARKHVRITQAQLAERLGYSSPQFISNWERGVARIPAQKFKPLSRILGRNAVVRVIDMRVSTIRQRLISKIK